jgi:transposase
MQKRSKDQPQEQLVRLVADPVTKRIWIGMDLGDRVSHLCVIDDQGNVIERTQVRTTPEAMREYFTAYADVPIAIEASAHSPWVSRVLTECGLVVTVADAREVRKIHQSNRKNDRSDAEILARMLRFDPKLLAPIQHRNASMQADISVLRARDTLVGARTSCINDDSGDQQLQLQITKAGNSDLRRLLVNSAPYILGPFGSDCRLRRYGEHLMKRGGKNAKKRAVVAVARKLAILLHHLWSTGSARIVPPSRDRRNRGHRWRSLDYAPTRSARDDRGRLPES